MLGVYDRRGSSSSSHLRQRRNSEGSVLEVLHDSAWPAIPRKYPRHIKKIENPAPITLGNIEVTNPS